MGNGSFKGMYLLKPGPLTILEEKLLVFMGQLLGIAVRSGVPFPLAMMPHFWQILVNLADQAISSVAFYKKGLL